MFDGLKDKLSSFQRDAEEELDEAAGEVDEPEPEPEGDGEIEASEAETAGTGTEDETETGGGTEIDSGSDGEATAEAASATDAAATSETTTTPETEGPDGEPASATADEPEEPAAETTESAADAARRGWSTSRTSGDREEGEDENEAGSDDGEGSDLGLGTRAKLFATGQSLIEAGELDAPLFDLEMALLESDVEMSVAEAILDRLREELTGATRAQVKTTGTVVEEALAEALREVISVGQFDFDGRIADADKPVTIVFTGINGVGKTTTIAKLARYFEERGLSTVLANGDTYRAGANEQLGEHADRLGKKLIAHDQGSDPAAVLYDAVEYAEANDIDVVLGDTAGRLHTSNDLMAQLAKIDRVVDPDMTLFVDEAVAGQDATNRAEEFDDAAAIDGAILAKADADSQGGAAISIAHVTGKPILFLGTGQGYDDIERFDPDVLVDRLLGGEE
ncbi:MULTISPECIES: signal recognition particle-docking protein FtsY [Halococcus]|uniref:Signal recognition particle receptor FtsY n=1 Tax=Halococcus salifodinae DSM 8989 TaxID=1227456 RepID=M0NBI4_9EURY|nr:MULTISPECIES: signal recognition particle-docking protein FtsY [Halococcus]EMA55337.1 cell division protein FtsY [Halococcus salifodinae DSM 8989]